MKQFRTEQKTHIGASQDFICIGIGEGGGNNLTPVIPCVETCKA